MKKLLFILVLILINKYSYSSDLFDTPFYEIEFISSNIENEKINKINEIKNKSLLYVFQKTLEYENYVKIKNILTENLINTFIKNIIINDEKIINDKYFSKIKINFDKKKIINFYREKNIPYVDYFPSKFLLIISENDKINNNLFSKNNNFYAFYKLHLKNNNVFKIPNLDINDRFILKLDHIKNRNFEKIKNFSNKYNLNEVIIVLTNKDNDKVIYDLILYSDGEIFEKRLKFNEYKLMKFYEILEFESINVWKKINQIQNKSLNIISCKLNYFNMFELKEIRDKLDNISIIENIQIKSLSFKNIEYDVYFYGNIKNLKKIFIINDLNIKNLDNICSISLK